MKSWRAKRSRLLAPRLNRDHVGSTNLTQHTHRRHLDPHVFLSSSEHRQHNEQDSSENRKDQGAGKPMEGCGPRVRDSGSMLRVRCSTLSAESRMEIMAGRNDRGCWLLDSIVTTSVQPTSPNIYTIVISIDLFFVQLFSTHRSSRSSDILVQSTCQNWPFERAQINTKTARKTHRKGKSKCLRTNQRERRRRRRKSRGPVHSCCQGGDE